MKTRSPGHRAKKKALILRYYWDCDYMPVQRTNKIAEALQAAGYAVTVVTRNWTGQERVWEDFLENSACLETRDRVEAGIRIISLPYVRPYAPAPPLSRFWTFANYVLGRFVENGNYAQLLPEILRIVRLERPDLILGSANPMDVVYVLSEVGRASPEALLAMDFLDYQNFTIGVRSRIQHFIQNLYLRRWLKDVAYVSTVSRPIADRLQRVCGTKVEVVYNGFYQNLVRGVRGAISPSRECFTISVLGALYPQQNLHVMTEGLNAFLANKHHGKVKVFFVGLRDSTYAVELIERTLWRCRAFWVVTSKVPHRSALELGAKSHVLFYAGWAGHKGILSTKIFDYLGLHRNILIAPGDRDALDELIASTQSGKVAHDSQEMKAFLDEWYNEWASHGELKYHGNATIECFSSEAQCREMVRSLDCLVEGAR